MPSGGGRREHIQTRGRSSPHKTLADSLSNTDAKLIVVGFYCTLHPKMQKVASAKDPNGMAQAAASSHAPYSVECPFRPSSTKDFSWEYEFITIRRSTEKMFGFYAEAISGQWRKYSDFALKLSVVYQTTIVSFIPFRSKEKIFGFFMSKVCLAEAISGQPMLGHQSHMRTKLSLLQSLTSSC